MIDGQNGRINYWRVELKTFITVTILVCCDPAYNYAVLNVNFGTLAKW